MRRSSHILVVASRFPFGNQEAYLSAELAELRQYCDRLTVVPTRTPSGLARQHVPATVDVLAWPLAGPAIAARAARTVLRHPARVIGMIGGIARSRDGGRLKNAAVLLKALALADWAERNGVDHLHAYWLSTPATVAMIAAVVSGARWSSTAHRWDIYERNAFDLKAKSVAFVRTISQRGADDLLQRAPALRGRIVAMRLGTVLPPPPVPRPPARDFPIVCPAALVPVKGQRDLLQAASLLLQRGVPLRASLAGTGPLLEGLRDEAARLGCGDAVAFEGFVPQATLHRWYRDGRFRACVLASRADGVSAMEGIPAALIEAMAFGVPVVATDSGSIGELVCPQTGLLVAAGDPEALAGALEDVYRDPAAAFQRARRAYERVAARHDVRVQMRRLADALSTERKIA